MHKARLVTTLSGLWPGGEARLGLQAAAADAEWNEDLCDLVTCVVCTQAWVGGADDQQC